MQNSSKASQNDAMPLLKLRSHMVAGKVGHNRYVCQAISSEMARSAFQGYSNSGQSYVCCHENPKTAGYPTSILTIIVAFPGLVRANCLSNPLMQLEMGCCCEESPFSHSAVCIGALERVKTLIYTRHLPNLALKLSKLQSVQRGL